MPDFTAKLRDSGADTLEITIPIQICRFLGLKEGDSLKVQIEKYEKEDDKNVPNTPGS